MLMMEDKCINDGGSMTEDQWWMVNDGGSMC